MIIQIETSVEKVNEALKKIREVGSVSMVSDNTGKFSAKGVRGRFLYDDGTLVIAIDDKPWIASDSMIESEIKKFFN